MPNDIQVTDSRGTKWTLLQAWVRQACTNAGIVGDSSDPLLRDISPGDSEGVKWAKLQRWIKLLAEGIGSSGGGSESAVVTTRALVATDAGKYLYSTGADAVALTIPADIFTADDEINLFQAGAGRLSVVAGDGVTIISKGSNLKLSETGSGAVLKYISANTWHLVGDLTA